MTNYTADTTNPTLSNFDLDLDSNNLVLNFDETVNVTSLNVATITLHSASPSTISYKLNNGTLPTRHTSKVTISLSQTDSNALRRLGICSTSTTCFLNHSAALVNDLVDLPVNATTILRAVRNYTADTTGPSLAQFTSFNLNSGQLVISFSETVITSSLKPANLALITLFENPLVTVNMSDGNTTSVNGTTLTYNLGTNDINTIKRSADICTYKGNCYFRIYANAVTDLYGNPAVATALSSPGFIVQSFTNDQVEPTLLRFSLDMNVGILNLTFNEPMDIQSLDARGITFHARNNTAVGDLLSYSLTGGTAVVNSADDVLVRITLTATDVDALKAVSYIKSANDTHLSMTSITIRDTSRNRKSVTAIPRTNTLQAAVFIKDSTPPKLTAFHLDLDADRLFLTFDEPVRGGNVSFNAASLRRISLASTNATSAVNHTLTGGQVLTAADGTKIVIVSLLQGDIRSLKVNSLLAVSQASTFLTASAGYIQDMARNPANNITNVRASVYSTDTSLPYLTSWSLDVNVGLLNLTFDDVMNFTTFKGSEVTLQDGVDAGASVALTDNSKAIAPSGYTITVNIAPADLLKLKETGGLTRNLSTSYLTIGAAAIDDVEGNDVVAITDGKGLIARDFKPDNTTPSLTNFTISLASGVLNLTFDDTVLATSLNRAGLRLQWRSTSSAQSVTLTGGNVSRSVDGKVLMVSGVT